MLSIVQCPMPEEALLNKYVNCRAYVDCFQTKIFGNVSHARYVEAFYTTKLFKLERIILKGLVSKPSADVQATELSQGTLNSFAAWHVEEGCENQLLLSDFRERTRSWLMIETASTDAGTITKLYFGSAVMSIRNTKTGETTMGLAFRLLLGFHKIYSVALLYSAKVRLEMKMSRDKERS